MIVPLMSLLALEEMLPSLPTPVAWDNSLHFASDSRWRSSLIGVAVRSSQSIFLFVIGLGLVLR